MILERIVDVEVLDDGGINVVYERICSMTGFRMRYFYHYIEGSDIFQSVCLGAS